ncbi:MAG: UDP-N-acetylmuramoylalanine--D-glutamate ligase [Parcubacteria group bacterium Gr01-1014_20]|nr:MAG: UDP-N-acetylmuramoylalanine--D-glutamate ligase [Parcubacteria group bacterium Gr01-1014_20]
MKRKLAILGFGQEGKSLLKFLRRSPKFKGSKIHILDKKDGKDYLSQVFSFDLIFRSPGVPYNLPELKSARRRGVEFSSGTKIFFEEYGGKIIGITGTKGKGTTSTLLCKILQAAGKKVLLAGNIGKPAIDFLKNGKKYDWAILELSSFQLQDLNISPTIAVVLDVFPDHQDAHLNLKEYYEAKANIGKYQGKSGRVFFFLDDKNSGKIASKSPARRIGVNYRKFKLFNPQELKIPGLHNFRNAVMAANVAFSLGIAAKTIKNVVTRFRGLEHRLEFVKRIGRLNFFNDSASTNPHTTAAAIGSFPGVKKILIAGGRDKVDDYSPIQRALKKHGIHAVILFGENKHRLQRVARDLSKVKLAGNLKTAVRMAVGEAKMAGGEVCVVFSPGSASFDMFRNYAHRGEEFKKLVKKIRF